MVGSPVTSGAMKQECWSMEINHIRKGELKSGSIKKNFLKNLVVLCIT